LLHRIPGILVQVNVGEATHLSALLQRVAAGEEVTIARAGAPIAKLVPYRPGQPRRPGGWEGLVFRDDFDAPLPDETGSAFCRERD
jgi:antitoxin (DNA-binding transcriptional repressor) of toxin-antitoxin stability system